MACMRVLEFRHGGKRQLRIFYDEKCNISSNRGLRFDFAKFGCRMGRSGPEAELAVIALLTYAPRGPPKALKQLCIRLRLLEE